MKRALLLLPITLLCSCGVSGGKKLATEQVLLSIEEFQKEKQPEVLLEEIQSQIASAKAAGEPSRKADVQVSLDLDGCNTAVELYTGYFAAVREQMLDERLDQTSKEMRRIHDKEKKDLADTGIRPLPLDERRSVAEGAMKDCVSNLRRDLD